MISFSLNKFDIHQYDPVPHFTMYHFNVFFQKRPSTYATAREIVRKDGFGLNGLNKGLTATFGRHGVFNMVYFSFYHNVKGLVPAPEVI